MRFGFGGINFGPDSSHVSEYSSELLRLLREHAARDYCPAIPVLGFCFCVESEVYPDWKPRRVLGPMRLERDNHLGCSINIPVAAWKGKTPREIREFHAGWFVIALNKAIAHPQGWICIRRRGIASRCREGA